MTDIFDVIADPTRRQLLTTLRDSLAADGAGASDVEVGEFVDVLGVTRPTVLKHLAVLREAGLVVERAEAGKRYFTLVVGPLEELEDWLVPFVGIGDHAGYVADLDEVSGFDAAVFAAWSGADVGESIGRQLADRSHHALTVFHDATEKVSKHMPRKGRNHA